MTDKIRQFWDKNAKRYDQIEKKSEDVNKDLIARTSKYLDPNDLVLDFGCATGNKAIELSKKVKFIKGIDISPEMISLANQKKDALNIPNISFSSGTIFSKELEPESFDIIVCFALIHLLEDLNDVTGRIHELLKPGGLVISVTPCFKDRMAFKTRLEFTLNIVMIRLGLLPLNLNMFTANDVKNLFSEMHFNIIESENVFEGISISFVVAEKREKEKRN